jgi:hypothetical protein
MCPLFCVKIDKVVYLTITPHWNIPITSIHLGKRNEGASSVIRMGSNCAHGSIGFSSEQVIRQIASVEVVAVDVG